MSDSTLFEDGLLETKSKQLSSDMANQLLSGNISGDPNLLRLVDETEQDMDFGDQQSDWTYKPIDGTYVPRPGQQPDPIKKTPPDPIKPDRGDIDNTPNIDPEQFREWVKQAKEEEAEKEPEDKVDPETLEAHRKRVEKLVDVLLEYLLKSDRSDVHMSGFMDEFEVVQKAMTTVRKGELLTDIEMHALNNIYEKYASDQ